MEDTVPLRIAAPGAEPQDLFAELLPAADLVAAWYTVHERGHGERPPAAVGGTPVRGRRHRHRGRGPVDLDLETGAMTTVP